MNLKVLKDELTDWDGNAEFYAQDAKSEIAINLRKRLLEFYSVAKEGYVLDLGCGAGDFSAEVGGELIALDFSIRMLKCARAKSLQCIRASADHLPFQKNIFNAIMANGLFHHLIIQGIFYESLSEIKRTLKKHGNLLTLDRSGNPIGIFMIAAIKLIKKGIRRLRKISECGTRNETLFIGGEIDKLYYFGFRRIDRTYMVSLLTYLLSAVLNGLHYFGSRISLPHLASFSTKLEFPKNKWFYMEQCLKLESV